MVLEQRHGETEILLSVISVIEMEHGFYRANNADLAQRRRDYLDTVFAAIPVQPFTKEMGQLAARIDTEARKDGRVIPFPDLLIGVTGLHFSCAVATRNLRHFQMIPGLNVVSL